MIRALSLLLAAAVLLPGSRQANDPAADLQHRVQAYVDLHRRVRALAKPPLGVTDDYKQICDACDALANGIAQARANARVGEIFTPPIAAWLRGRVRSVATPEAIEAWSRDMYDAGEKRPDRRVTVNSRVRASEYSNVTPMALLKVLPALPRELAYRLHGRDLLLVDVDAELVVDLLPEALPPVPQE